jgi:hypothetical protein
MLQPRQVLELISSAFRVTEKAAVNAHCFSTSLNGATFTEAISVRSCRTTRVRKSHLLIQTANFRLVMHSTPVSNL